MHLTVHAFSFVDVFNVVDGQKVKTRGGKKKRKKPLRDRDRDRHDGEKRQRNHDPGDPEFSKLFEPLTVTSDDSEEAVARELAEKLNEVRYAHVHVL